MRRLTYFALVLAACGDDGGSSSPDARMIDGPLPPTVTVTLTNRPNVPANFGFAVVYRDGTGAWKAAPAPVNDAYAIPVESSSYAVGWTCVSAPISLREVNLYYFTKAERPSLTLAIPDYCTDRATQQVTLSGTVANRPTGSMSAAFGFFAGDVLDNGTYTFMTTPGTHDVVAGHLVVAGGNAVADTAAVSRNVAISGSGAANLDYANAAATQTATVDVTSTGSIQVRTTLYTAGDTRFRTSDMTTGAFVAVGLPSALAQADDIYNIQVRTIQSGSTLITQDWKSTVSATTFTAPAALGTVTPTVAGTTPYPRLDLTWGSYDTAVGYQVVATQSQTALQCATSRACTVTWTANVSPGIAGTTPAFQMPNFSAIVGWTTGLQFKTGTPVTGFVSASASSAGATDFPLTTVAAAGAHRTIAATDFSTTP